MRGATSILVDPPPRRYAELVATVGGAARTGPGGPPRQPAAGHRDRGRRRSASDGTRRRSLIAITSAGGSTYAPGAAHLGRHRAEDRRNSDDRRRRDRPVRGVRAAREPRPRRLRQPDRCRGRKDRRRPRRPHARRGSSIRSPTSSMPTRGGSPGMDGNQRHDDTTRPRSPREALRASDVLAVTPRHPQRRRRGSVRWRRDTPRSTVPAVHSLSITALQGRLHTERPGTVISVELLADHNRSQTVERHPRRLALL